MAKSNTDNMQMAKVWKECWLALFVWAKKAAHTHFSLIPLFIARSWWWLWLEYEANFSGSASILCCNANTTWLSLVGHLLYARCSTKFFHCVISAILAVLNEVSIIFILIFKLKMLKHGEAKWFSLGCATQNPQFSTPPKKSQAHLGANLWFVRGGGFCVLLGHKSSLRCPKKSHRGLT